MKIRGFITEPDGEALTLSPSCNVPGLGVSYPPVRLTHFLRELQRSGATTLLQSTCPDDFTPTIDLLIRRIR